MSPAEPPPVAVDPNLAAQQAAAQNEMIKNLQVQSQSDTASIMARYGTRLAMSGGTGAATAPLVTPSSPSPQFARGTF